MPLSTIIQNRVPEDWKMFENLMAQTLKSESEMLEYINKYLLNNAGKKLRPLLCLLTAKACSGFINEKTIACAAVSELIHTATLLHDDVVDDGDYRRGKLTVCKLFSKGTSLLVGDYWLTKAIHLMMKYDCPISVIEIYARALENLAEGEMIQMDCANSLKTDYENYKKIISYKTASLFVASIKSPAIVQNASQEVVSKMTEYAEYLGICFQIRDDILDYHPTSETGKNSDVDISERKITLPLLCAFKNCPAREEYIRGRMSEIDISQKQKNKDIIAEIKQFVIDNSGVESAIIILKDYIAKAAGCLSILDESPSRSDLLSITQGLGENL